MTNAEQLLLCARLTPIQWRALLAWGAEQGPDTYEALAALHRKAQGLVAV